MTQNRSALSRTTWKRGLWMLSTVLLAACGGGGGGGDSITGPAPGGGTPEPTMIEGTAKAPAAGVAYFETKSAFQLALEFIAPPAAAAILGLEPVSGATVELIRIDDAGEQIGDVLATTTTSISGDYTLTLPEGVSLAGNLIVRIQGMGGTEMRAQVVEEAVDISPVSDFVLQKFIDNGADLADLTTSAVVQLTGHVEEFDLTVGADLAETLAILEAETGGFVDAQVYIAVSGEGDAASVAGNYHHFELGLGLHDHDASASGTLAVEIDFVQDLALADGGDGSVDVTIGGEEIAEALLIEAGNSRSLRYLAEIDSEADSFTAPLSEAGVMSIESEFEESIEGEFGWRFPPSVARLQKANGANVFAALAEEAAVRYRTTDTNGDGTADAVDPEQREGDEVHRSLLLLAEKVQNATLTELTGDYGRIGLLTTLTDSGYVELELERNKLTFDGAGSLDVAAGTGHILSAQDYLSAPSDPATGLSITLDEDGSLQTLDGEPVDGFVGAGYDLLVIGGAAATDDQVSGDEYYADVTFDTTLAVKLPLAMLDLQNRSYRVLFMGLEMDGSWIALSNSHFDSVLRVTGSTTGELDISTSYISKDSLLGSLSAEIEEDTGLPVEIALAADGATTLTVSNDEGTFTADGYLNHDGSIGVFHTLYAEAGADPIEGGVMVLLEVQ